MKKIITRMLPLRPEDIRKIRKRIDTTLSNYRSIYGCYVNGVEITINTEE